MWNSERNMAGGVDVRRSQCGFRFWSLLGDIHRSDDCEFKLYESRNGQKRRRRNLIRHLCDFGNPCCLVVFFFALDRLRIRRYLIAPTWQGAKEMEGKRKPYLIHRGGITCIPPLTSTFDSDLLAGQSQWWETQRQVMTPPTYSSPLFFFLFAWLSTIEKKETKNGRLKERKNQTQKWVDPYLYHQKSGGEWWQSRKVINQMSRSVGGI